MKKKWLLALCILASVQVMAMESDLQAEQKLIEEKRLKLAKLLVANRKGFLKRKILRSYELCKDSLYLEERISRKKILDIWQNELECLKSWILTDGVINVGLQLALQLEINKTKNQLFFGDLLYEDDEEILLEEVEGGNGDGNP